MNRSALHEYHPKIILLVVFISIIISETIAIVLIDQFRNPWEELIEVLLLTFFITSLVYILLIRPLVAEIARRQATEAELRGERDRLNLVTGAIGAGLAIIDRDFRVVWINRVMEQAFDCATGGFCYNTFKNSYTGPCDECGVRAVFESGRRHTSSEHLLVDTRGVSSWYQVIVTPITGEDGSIDSALELLIPIGDRKNLEEALANSQKRFQSLVESSSDWVWEVDAAGRYTYAGPQCRPLLGYSPEEIIGTTPFELMSPEERERVAALFSAIVAERRSFTLLENSLIHKDGRTVVMETSGTPFFDNAGNFCGYRGIDRDISARKALEKLQHEYKHQLEQQVREQTDKLQRLLAELKQNYSELQCVESSLRQSELRFRQIFDQNRDAILLFFWGSEMVFDANPASQAMFEGDYDILKGMSWAGFQLRDDSGAPLKLHEVCSQGEFLLMKCNVTTLGGRDLIVSMWGKLLELEGHQVVYCSLRDITEKTRLEKEAQQIQTKLIQTNKMTSLGFLVAGIAHEINNPNNNILLSAQLLVKIWQDVLPILERRFREEGDFILGGDVYSEVRESIPKFFTMITDGSRRIEIIINNLRDFTIKSKSELSQTVDINRIVSVSVSILQHQIKKHTRAFTLCLSPETLTVRGNQQQMEQVIVNLVVNAIQSLPSLDRAVRVETSADPATGSAVITVSDEGCGIEAEHLAYVFEPFFSTKLEAGGTGLGLAISSHITKEHGGRLEIRSTPGCGTVATVILPASHSPHKENPS